MRKLLLGLLMVTCSTPAMADPYDYNQGWGRHRQYDYNRGWGGRHRNYDHHRGTRAEDVVIPIIGGIILGAIISGSNRNDNRYERRRTDGDYIYRQPPPREYVYDTRCDCYR